MVTAEAGANPSRHTRWTQRHTMDTTTTIHVHIHIHIHTWSWFIFDSSRRRWRRRNRLSTTVKTQQAAARHCLVNHCFYWQTLKAVVVVVVVVVQCCRQWSSRLCITVTMAQWAEKTAFFLTFSVCYTLNNNHLWRQCVFIGFVLKFYPWDLFRILNSICVSSTLCLLYHCCWCAIWWFEAGKLVKMWP